MQETKLRVHTIRNPFSSGVNSSENNRYLPLFMEWAVSDRLNSYKNSTLGLLISLKPRIKYHKNYGKSSLNSPTYQEKGPIVMFFPKIAKVRAKTLS